MALVVILRLFCSPSWKHLLQVLMQYFETISIFYAYLNKPASKSKRFLDIEVVFKQTVDSKGSIHSRGSSPPQPAILRKKILLWTKQLNWRKSRFSSNTELGILPIKRFQREWRWSKGQIWNRSNIVARKYLSCRSNKRKTFWEWFILFNELSAKHSFVIFF